MTLQNRSINYIIRIEPTQQDMITAEGTREHDGFQVANEGDTVTVKLGNLPKGYDKVTVYSDTGKKCKLLQDENGDYYLVVPRGGGVLLSLRFQRTAYVKATFNPNGGTIGGKEGPIVKTVVKNTAITLPQPDEREGYLFAGWFAGAEGPDAEGWVEPDADDPRLLAGGAQFQMTEDTCFTAIWKAAE